MIDDPLPKDWRELQAGVCRLFSEIGLTAEVEASLKTPRGTITVDVFAVDNQSVDKIKYIVECKTGMRLSLRQLFMPSPQLCMKQGQT